MNKIEVKKLTDKIKGYYNSQFFIDDYVLDTWYETMAPYDLEDAEEHIKEYLKEYPEIAPKPHTFKKGLLTREEKERRKNAKYTVECNLCHNWMTYEDYEEHYERCLDIEYLIGVAKQQGKNLTREELENSRDDVIRGLLTKYPPEKININEAFKTI